MNETLDHALTIAFITGRAEPRLDWLLASLAPQVHDFHGNIDLIVVDRLDHTFAELGVDALVDASPWLTDVTLTLPKPTAWQGRHRITSQDWFAKSNAINTALVLCQTDYIAFVDDRSHLSPTWLETVERGRHEHTSVLAGAYVKRERGGVTHDTRLDAAPRGRVNCGGGWLYGCTYALPLAWALDVNGAEEGMDGMGFEDCIFGLMLANAGYRIDYAPAMSITQERDGISGVTATLARRDKGLSPHDKSHAALARFGKRRRTEFTPDLRVLRAAALAETPWPLPDPDLRDWFDGERIADMTAPP